MEIKFANKEVELKKIIELRYLVLREPWNQPLDSATDNLEQSSVNAFIEEDGKVMACGRLQDNGQGVGQIRYMAVHPGKQGKGLGKIILEALEAKANEIHLHTVELQARKNALEFYLKNGYTNLGPSFKLWDIIEHFLMKKELN
ncbi:MAG: acetyltransferase, family [Bacteroidota bacterium]|jgi:predicted GNAT family N-acyltransferase|nr:acetyltransferase, family [Bacteroidota bacterium]